jgi:hypothetical protein
MYNVLAIDLGFSSIKWAYTDPDTKQLVVEKMISAIAKLPEAPLDVDDEEIFQLGSNYFVIGQSCLDTARSYQLSLTNFDELKEAYQQYEDTREAIEDLDNEIDDKFYEWQDNNFEMWNHSLEISIDITDDFKEVLDTLLSRTEGDFFK